MAGTNPNASFTIALNTARDQVVYAAAVIAGVVIDLDLVGTTGRAAVTDLLPDRRAGSAPAS